MIFPKQIDTSLMGRIEDLEKAFAAGAYLSAISLALTIPDVCGDRLYPDRKKLTRRRYVDWFNEYIAFNYLDETSLAVNGKMTACRFYFSGEDCYQLRCVYLHQGINATEPTSGKTSYNMIQFRVFNEGPGDCDHIGRTTVDATDEDAHDEVTIQVDLDLRKFIRCIRSGVEHFLEEHPEMNADNGSESFLYGPVLDFEHGRELP